jgi:hypothetical protein
VPWLISPGDRKTKKVPTFTPSVEEHIESSVANNQKYEHALMLPAIVTNIKSNESGAAYACAQSIATPAS